MIQHQPDWVPGGRYGTREGYEKGYKHIFGDRGIFKNLTPKELQNKKEETDEG